MSKMLAKRFFIHIKNLKKVNLGAVTNNFIPLNLD